MLEHVTGAQYRAFVGRFSPSQIQRRMLGLYIYPFLFPWLPVLVAAVRARGFTERLIGSALCGAALLQVLSTFTYGVPDPAPYFLPPVALALCATAPVGAGLLTGGARRRRLIAAAFGALGVAALALAGPWISRAALRRVLLVELERRVRATWSAIPFERGFVLWGDDMYHRLQGYQVLGREKPDLMVVNPLALSGPAPRRRFHDQFGFDPYDGVVVSPDLVLHPTGSGPLDQFVTDVGRRIKAGTGLPVAVFDWRRGVPVPIEEPASP